MESAMEKATESCRSENLENSLWDNTEVNFFIYI